MVNSSNIVDPRCSIFIELKHHIQTVESCLAEDHSQISTALQPLQMLFEEQVQVLTWEAWPPERRSLLQSLRVEMHKQLRLLNTDLMFFRAAKQPVTLDQRRSDMGDRLTNLQGYCDAILKLAESPEASGDPS